MASNRPRTLGLGLSTCALAAAAWVLARCPDTLAALGAHPVLVASGTLTFDGERLAFAFEPSAHDLQHEGLDPDEPASWATLAKSLAASVAVLDERGARRPVTVVEATSTTTRLITNLGKHARFITLQLRPDGQFGARALNRQVHLTWTPPSSQTEMSHGARGDSLVPSRTLRLTTGGNSEVVDLHPPSVAHDAAPGSDAEPPFDSLFSRIFLVFGHEVRAHGRPIRIVRCSVPLPLLQTWADLAEPRTDALSLEEIKSLEARATAWLATALCLEDPAGTPVRTTIEGARIIGPDASAYMPVTTPRTPLNRWSARFIATIVPHSEVDLQWLHAYWTAFNATVATVDVLVDGNAGELRASQCGLRVPSLASGRVWQPLPEGASPAVPRP